MTHLIFVAGPNAGRRYRLSPGESIIGRRSDCQVFVPDMRVSRQHAKITDDAGRWFIDDLGSNNGTFVNGHKVQRTELRHGDEIAIAANRIRVELPEHSTSTSERPASIDAHVTVVEASGSQVWRARDDAGAELSRSLVLPHSDLAKTLRVVERRAEALTSILEASAATGDAQALLGKVADAILTLFPGALEVGVLLSEPQRELGLHADVGARDGTPAAELRVACHRRRVSPHDGTGSGSHSELRVPGTIIRQVSSDRRGILLGDLPVAGVSDGGSTGGSAGISDDARGSRMGAPLLHHTHRFGLLYVESIGAEFRQDDVDLLTLIASHTALALHAAEFQAGLANRERLERDLRMARQIQRSLLPAEPPNVVGLDVAIHYEPAYQIGGDFYDFIWHDASHLGLVVGDVAGKAISAALYMARLTSELRSRAGIARTPARLLRRVNQEMVKIGDDGMFATLVYCIYDLETRSLVFTNAGHCVPLLRRGDRVFPLHADRAHIAPVGVLPDLDAGEARVQLQSGDVLVLVSDGILETRDARGHEYGVNRLSRRLRTARGNAADIVKAILQDVDSHGGAAGPPDDMTLLVMAIDDRRAKRKTTTLPGIPTVGGPDGLASPPDTDPGTGQRAL